MGKVDLHNIWRGLIMGTTEVIPGVSSGTLAIVLGIYERLIAAINHLSTRKWKEGLAFLIPLVSGILIAVVLAANAIEWLLDQYPMQLFYFFLGLILGIVPFLLKKINAKQSFQLKHYLIFTFSIILIILFGVIQGEETESVLGNLSIGHYVAIFFAGWVASSAMILPGISGAFILLVTGYFRTVIEALSTLHIPVLAVLVAGIVIGVLITSKIVHYFLKTYPIGTYAAVIGLVTGAAVVIFPGLPENAGTLFTSIAAIIAGFIIAGLLGRIEHQDS